jgi:hypothetical protein
MNARKIAVLLVVAALLVTALFSTATSQPTPAVRRTVFSSLKVGQPVNLKDKGALFEISTIDESTPLSHKVVEVGDDFVVLRDEAGVVERCIPVTAVRAVTHSKIKGK